MWPFRETSIEEYQQDIRHLLRDANLRMASARQSRENEKTLRRVMSYRIQSWKDFLEVELKLFDRRISYKP